MTDAKYFANSKKGEIFELKGELNSDKKEKRKEAVKKVIASMTVGKGRQTIHVLQVLISIKTASLTELLLIEHLSIFPLKLPRCVVPLSRYVSHDHFSNLLL